MATVNSVTGASGSGFLWHRRVALHTGSSQASVVVGPELLLLRAQKIKIVPGKNASVMAVRKHRLHRIISHRLKRIEFHQAFAGLQYFLPGTMATHFGRWGIQTHQLKRNTKLSTVRKTYFQHPGLAVHRHCQRRWSA